jgi:hypothetical protein
MQKITISGTDLVTVVGYLYPDLDAPKDFAAEKSSDSEDLFLDWKSDTHPMPTDAELKENLKAANKAKEDAAAAKQAEAEAKATARAEILDRLGLTADEAAILLG